MWHLRHSNMLGQGYHVPLWKRCPIKNELWQLQPTVKFEKKKMALYSRDLNKKRKQKKPYLAKHNLMLPVAIVSFYSSKHIGHSLVASISISVKASAYFGDSIATSAEPVHMPQRVMFETGWSCVLLYKGQSSVWQNLPFQGYVVGQWSGMMGAYLLISHASSLSFFNFNSRVQH